MTRILLGVVLGVALVLCSGAAFILLGGMPVAARGKPLPMERLVAGISLNRAIGAEADRPSPLPADEANLAAGAQVYRTHCAVCHGLPGDKQPGAIAQGLFPHAPQLWPPRKGVTDDPVGEIFWKAKNGIRLTGMPGFGEALSDTELWQVSLLCQKADQAPPSVLQQLARAGPAAAPAPAAPK